VDSAVSPDTAVYVEPVDLNGLHAFRACSHNGKDQSRVPLREQVCCCTRNYHHARHDFRPTSITEVAVAYAKPHTNRLGCLEALYGDLTRLPCQCEEVPSDVRD